MSSEKNEQFSRRMGHREGLGPEHPFNDTLQLILFIMYFIIWGIDSFYWKLTNFLNETVPLWVRIIFFLFVLTFAIFLVKKSGSVMFTGNHTGKVVREGVYEVVRHPMYMGEISIYLAFFFLTLSLVSFAFILLTWILINYMANYEEKEMEQRLGQEYLDYKSEVGKWFPKKF